MTRSWSVLKLSKSNRVKLEWTVVWLFEIFFWTNVKNNALKFDWGRFWKAYFLCSISFIQNDKYFSQTVYSRILSELSICVISIRLFYKNGLSFFNARHWNVRKSELLLHQSAWSVRHTYWCEQIRCVTRTDSLCQKRP